MDNNTDEKILQELGFDRVPMPEGIVPKAPPKKLFEHFTDNGQTFTAVIDSQGFTWIARGHVDVVPWGFQPVEDVLRQFRDM